MKPRGRDRVKADQDLPETGLDRSFLVANAQPESCHIIFCSDGFCKMTGFTRAEVMQRSACTEFLQGQMTSQAVVQSIKEALRKGEEKHFEILYYRKNGEWIQ
ncbi:AAEL001560-PA [Aedes aegypti]|uniref:AAEL001560-PA n=1 Tax=Aedes aegypti TaxID=7159 RepID=Q17KW7_AEDAE|nr:AAEL001560-PA [Aedes aegypti]